MGRAHGVGMRRGAKQKHGTCDKAKRAARIAAELKARKAAARKAKRAALKPAAPPASPAAPTAAVLAVFTPVTVSAVEARRQAIVFFYHQLGSPPEDEWPDAGGTVALIRQQLGLPSEVNVRFIFSALRRHTAGQSLAYKPGVGRKRKPAPRYLSSTCARGAA